MKKLLLLLLFSITISTGAMAQTAEVLARTNTSTSPRAPKGDAGSMRLIYYLSASEIIAAGIPINSSLSSIGFVYSAAPTIATTGNTRILLQNTTDTYLNKSTTWSTATTGMTVVKNETATIGTTSPIKYDFQNPFVWTGGGLYVAMEFVNAGTSIATASAGTIRTNSGTFSDPAGDATVTIRYSTSTTTTLPTSTTTTNSASRPVTLFDYTAPTTNITDLSVDMIYVLDKKPSGTNGAESIRAVVRNVNNIAVANKDVTLNVSGANNFTNVKQVTLNPGESTVVTFDSFTSSTIGTNTIDVTVADDNVLNNKSTSQTVNDGIYAYPQTVNTGSLGVGSSDGGILLVKYGISGSSNIKAVNVTLGTSSTLDVGTVKVYAVVMTPAGVTLGRSDDYTVLSTDKGTKKTFLLQTPVSLTNQEFLVGLAYYNVTVNTFPVSYYAESPIRTNVLYRRVGGLTDDIAVTASAAGLPAIEAVLETSSTLPVNIKTFNAKLNNGKVNLSWTVGTETNVNRYEVERSANGKDFVKVATVTALGNASYSVSDANPLIGINYYRLQGVDNDGTLSPFNELRSVKLSTLENSNAVVYPNPLVGNVINVSLSNYAGGDYQYKLVDALGKVVQQGNIKNNGSETSAIAVSNSLNKGIYLLHLIAGEQVIQSKLVKR